MTYLLYSIITLYLIFTLTFYCLLIAEGDYKAYRVHWWAWVAVWPVVVVIYLCRGMK
jgi:hypothetical protein